MNSWQRSPPDSIAQPPSRSLRCTASCASGLGSATGVITGGGSSSATGATGGGGRAVVATGAAGTAGSGIGGALAPKREQPPAVRAASRAIAIGVGRYIDELSPQT